MIIIKNNIININNKTQTYSIFWFESKISKALSTTNGIKVN